MTTTEYFAPATYCFADTAELSRSAELAKKLIALRPDAAAEIVADRQNMLDELHDRAMTEYWGPRPR